MRHGAAERGLGRGLGVDMDELPILGGVGESVDPRLVDRQPAGNADLCADPALQLVQRNDRHQALAGEAGGA